MATDVLVERFAAFTDDPGGGNPAGVVLDAAGLTSKQMQAIAAHVGYSETAFVTGPIEQGSTGIPIRYFAPQGEVDFCGHATIATAAAIGLSAGPGEYLLSSNAGPLAITAKVTDGRAFGALTSPPLGCFPLAAELVDELLSALGWERDVLHSDFPPAVGFGGNKHPVLVVLRVDDLAGLSYDFGALQRLCRAHDWITVQLVAPTGPRSWRSRNPFPWGGVIEDPATGAAAAALAGYLRAQARAAPGDTFVITQGVEMGRPSRIEVELLEDAALISGAAVRLEGR